MNDLTESIAEPIAENIGDHLPAHDLYDEFKPCTPAELRQMPLVEAKRLLKGWSQTARKLQLLTRTKRIADELGTQEGRTWSVDRGPLTLELRQGEVRVCWHGTIVFKQDGPDPYALPGRAWMQAYMQAELEACVAQWQREQIERIEDEAESRRTVIHVADELADAQRA